MLFKNRGQISTEYLIVIGFVVFIIIMLLGAGLLYSSQLSNRVQMNQLNNFANKIIQSAEAVYYAGDPSRVTITAYLPAGVTGISIQSSDIVFNVSTNSGLNVIAFSSDVPMEGGFSFSEGVKRLQIRAVSGKVLISQS